LQADQPLTQYPGFDTQTTPILESDLTLYAIYITLPDGSVLFQNRSESAQTQAFLNLDDPLLLQTFTPISGEERSELTENDDFYQVTLPLENRFGVQGYLHLALPKVVVTSEINRSFNIVWLSMVLALTGYVLFLFFTSNRWMVSTGEGWTKGGVRLLAISYTAMFVFIAVMVTFSLVSLYVAGIQTRTQALSSSLGYRLREVLNAGLSVSDFSGMDDLLAEYMLVNQDLSYVAISEDNLVVLSTQPDRVGQTWQQDTSQFEYTVQASDNGSRSLEVHMGIPRSVVVERLWRTAKNFVALFVASAFITQLFFSLIRAQSTQPKLTKGQFREHRGFLLSLIGPAYFLLIFVTNGMTASFLPQYFKQLAAEAGVGLDISTLFSIYYLVYAASLLFAGRYADEHDTRPLLILGATLVAVAFLLMAFVPNFYVLFLTQIMTGFGEGVFFIAVQAYILKIASAEHRTRGAAIVVSSLYSGMLSGTAIGSLLVVDPSVGQRGVFLMAVLIAVFMVFFVLKVVPSLAGEDFTEKTPPKAVEKKGREFSTLADTMEIDIKSFRQQLEEAKQAKAAGITQPPPDSFWAQFKSALTDLEFLLTALLIGVPVKIILAGLFKASLPLILTQQNYPTDDVGQIMMMYYGTVLLASFFVSPLTDRWGETRSVLTIGAIGSGIGLLLMGIIGLPVFREPAMVVQGTLFLILGMLVLGLSHGFIQAPIITHIAGTTTSTRLGKSTATSIYRLYERFGNIGGPMLVGTILVNLRYSAVGISWIGALALIFGLVFAVRPNREKR
jgi:MFS family permease